MKYLVQERAFHLKGTYKDPAGNVLASLRKKMTSEGDMEIDDGNGSVIAKLQPEKGTGFGFPAKRRRYDIYVRGSQLAAIGEFTGDWALRDRLGQVIAGVSRQWALRRGAYGVEVERGQNVPLIISIAVCVNQAMKRTRRLGGRRRW